MSVIKDILMGLALIVAWLSAAFFIMSSSGCAIVRIKTPEWSMSGMSLFKSIEIPLVTKGDFTVKGYKGNVEGDALGEAVGTAGKVFIK